MGRRLFVGNLSYQTDENELTELFSQFGAVENAQIMRDMATRAARVDSRLSRWPRMTKPRRRPRA